MSSVGETMPSVEKPARPARYVRILPGRATMVTIASIAGGILIWEILSLYLPPLFLPSPRGTLLGAIELWHDGTLQSAIVASSLRILVGWSLGVVIGVPVGILMGHFRIIREILDPYIEFFRFIPPIALVTLAVIWLGPGELSKVALIFYTTIFLVTLNTLAGVRSVPDLRLRAAASLGAGPLQTLWTVIVPSTVPYMVTGARLALGNSFLTIVSAEIVSADDGLGALIWLARNYSRTEWVFTGIIVLGWLGYGFDRVLKRASVRLFARYGVNG